MDSDIIKSNNSKLKNIKYTFDKISSNNAKDWQLALFWIVLFEISAVIFEYFFVKKSHIYIEYIPQSFYKEIFVAALVVPFVWLCVYNLIFTNKSNLLYLGLYAVIGLYLVITQDVTFNLLLHNLNPLELDIGGSIYFVVQIIFKLFTTYLIFQLVVALRNKKV